MERVESRCGQERSSATGELLSPGHIKQHTPKRVFRPKSSSRSSAKCTESSYIILGCFFFLTSPFVFACAVVPFGTQLLSIHSHKCPSTFLELISSSRTRIRETVQQHLSAVWWEVLLAAGMPAPVWSCLSAALLPPSPLQSKCTYTAEECSHMLLLGVAVALLSSHISTARKGTATTTMLSLWGKRVQDKMPFCRKFTF